MLAHKLKQTIAGVVAATMLNGCIAPQKYSWKTESVVSTRYEKVGEETAKETRYKISPSVSENGILSLSVKKQEYDVDYGVLQPIESQRQREYAYGRSKKAATWTNVGFGVTALGVILELTTSVDESCLAYNYSEDDEIASAYENDPICMDTQPGRQGTPGADAVLGIGLGTATIGGIIYWSKNGKRSRPTKNYQTIEVPLDTRERKPEADHFLATVPAIGATVEVTSSYFTINGTGHTVIAKTNVMGNVTVQLDPSSQTFVYSLDQLADTDAAQQFKQAGYAEARYLPLLQQAATPVSYEVKIETKATDGKNTAVTILVNGHEISQEALEKTVMEL